MAISVRPVDFDSEQQEFLNLLQRNLKDLPHARRFDWLYRNNPAGTAWSWFAYEKQTTKLVGVASLFPRAMWVGKEIRLCGQVGDFAIDISHRSLGPALMLQRVTFDPVNRGTLALCYDCPPDDRGMSTFRRLGIEPHCQMLRYAKLLKTDRQFARRIGTGKLAAGFALVGNRWLSLWNSRQPAVAGLDVSLYKGRFGEEFSVLDRQVGRSDVVRGRRSAADLNWRYRDDPLRDYEILTARKRGELVAFMVVSSVDQDAHIIDLFGSESANVALELLHATAEHLGTQPIQTLQAHIAAGSPLAALLQKADFRYRSQSARVVAYAQPDGEVFSFLASRPQWLFSHADVLI